MLDWMRIEEIEMPGGKVKKRNQLIAAALVLHQGSVFSQDAPKPLAKKVETEISEAFPGLEKREIDLFLRWWCNRFVYLKACAAEGSHRYHLDGRCGEQVAEPERNYAKGRIRTRKAKPASPKKLAGRIA